jgi:hypothetical protein
MLRQRPKENSASVWTNPWTNHPARNASSVKEWCAENLDAPLLTCGFVVFRGWVWKSVLLVPLFPLNQKGIAMMARIGSRCAVVSPVATVALAILPVNVKATSRAPILHL